MDVLRVQLLFMCIFSLALAFVVPSINAQIPAPAPAPTSDGTTLDQGIACILMLLALVLTYIIH
ncbi:putative arabinogalactan peptide, AGP [Medicago truncatula]|uniref:Arabinogalactan protein n=1 Tax=Medicago truncatula TaxID=3880 RepID=A0A072UC76_MEDTR|nr:arabinogalactan protein [Medicago truncatula]RHN53081.1 putative arabinogalactan peptide, AGP [Medicago truncatula]